MSKANVFRKFATIVAVFIAMLILSTTVAYAAVPSYSSGDHDLGGFHMVSSHTGATRTYYATSLKIKPAWKATDSSTSEVKLYVKVVRASNGNVAYSNTFHIYNDIDGKDASRWWYAESVKFNINYGSDYYIYYEFFTEDGYKGTGYNRSGDVHTWMQVGNLGDAVLV